MVMCGHSLAGDLERLNRDTKFDIEGTELKLTGAFDVLVAKRSRIHYDWG